MGPLNPQSTHTPGFDQLLQLALPFQQVLEGLDSFGVNNSLGMRQFNPCHLLNESWAIGKGEG